MISFSESHCLSSKQYHTKILAVVRFFRFAVVIVLTAGSMLLADTGWAGTMANYYVSPTGSDSNAGTISAPFLTIAHARDVVSTISPMTGDIIVHLRGGTYELSTPVVFDQSDSGRNGYDIIYQAYSGETPVISGGTSVSGWSLYDSSKNIWSANVGTLQTRQLYINGKRAIRARSAGRIPGTVTKTSTGYTTTDTTMQNWGNSSNIEFVYTGNDSGASFTESRCCVAGISGNGSITTITMQEPGWTNGTVYKGGGRINLPTYIENAYELLDEPGEWYLDSTSGILYYIPRLDENMSMAKVVVPRLEALISGSGTATNQIRNIRFIGITFAHATWLQPSGNNGFIDVQANVIYTGTGGASIMSVPGNVAFHTAHYLVFERNIFQNLGGQGLVLDQGAQNNTVVGNVFTDISSCAIRIGDVLSPNASGSVRDTDNCVANNYVTNVGNEYHGAPAIMAGYVSDMTINHNEIANVPYSGVSMGWGWGASSNMVNNGVAYNDIHDHMQLLSDGGAIYTLSAQGSSLSSLGYYSSVHDNYIHQALNESGSLFPDEGSAFFKIYNNVVAGVPRWLHIWPGANGGTPVSYVDVRYNYSTTDVKTQEGTDHVTLEYNQENLSFPGTSEVQSIVSTAGIQTAYQSIKDRLALSANIAINKSASASSEGSGYPASNANNGSTDVSGGWWSQYSDTNAWWQVDLGDGYKISAVALDTRKIWDEPEMRKNFQILGSNDPTFATYTVLGSQGSTPVPFGGTFWATVNDSNTYRYVRAKKINDYFYIAQLRVYGVQNIAFNKPASASSIIHANYAASNANNGSTDVNGGWSPSASDPNPWWQVDLGNGYKIGAIALDTRKICDDPGTRANFQILGSNDPTFATYTVLGSQGSTPVPFGGTFYLPTTDNYNLYRYIRATKSGYFFIAQFRVYGVPSIALNKSASASSIFNANYAASNANNGSTDVNGGWSPTATDSNPWWQVDLGAGYKINVIALDTRKICDDPSTRANFQILGSNDPTFATYTVLGSQDSTPVPFGGTFLAVIDDSNTYRYVRATKSGYFFIEQLRIY